MGKLTDEKFDAKQNAVFTVLSTGTNLVDFDISALRFGAFTTPRTDWIAKYAIGGKAHKGTRSPQDTKNKTTARGVLEPALNLLVKENISTNPLVPDSARTAMLLNTPKTGKTPMPDVVTVPTVSTGTADGMYVKFLYVCPIPGDDKTTKAKPFNVASVEFAVLAIMPNDTTTHTVDECLAINHFFTGKTPKLHEFLAADKGKNGLVWARFIGKNKKTGPWILLPVSFKIPGNL